MTMPPEDLIDELWRKVVLAPDEPELEAALDELQFALQKHRDYLESVKPSSRYPETVKHTPRKDRGLIFPSSRRAFS